MIKRLLSAVALCAVLASPAYAQTTIDTIGAWPGNGASGYGVPNTATVGQTFTIGEAVLESLDARVGNCTAAMTIRAHVYQWDSVNFHRTGSSLFDGAPIVIPAGAGFTSVHQAIPNLVLAAGTYEFDLSNSEDQAGGATTCQIGTTFSDVYANGVFAFLANGTDTATLSTTPWFNGGPNFGDMAFTLTFAGSAVPTMPAWVMLALVSIVLAAGMSMMRRSPHHAI